MMVHPHRASLHRLVYGLRHCLPLYVSKFELYPTNNQKIQRYIVIVHSNQNIEENDIKTKI